MFLSFTFTSVVVPRRRHVRSRSCTSPVYGTSYLTSLPISMHATYRTHRHHFFFFTSRGAFFNRAIWREKTTYLKRSTDVGRFLSITKLLFRYNTYFRNVAFKNIGFFSSNSSHFINICSDFNVFCCCMGNANSLAAVENVNMIRLISIPASNRE